MSFTNSETQPSPHGRLRFGRTVALASLSTLVGAGCGLFAIPDHSSDVHLSGEAPVSAEAPPPEPCDLQAVDGALANAREEPRADARRETLIVELAQACDEPLAEAFRSEDHAELASWIDHNALRWARACKGGLLPFAEAAQASVDESRRILYERCQLEALGWELHDWLRVDGDIRTIVAASYAVDFDADRRDAVLRQLMATDAGCRVKNDTPGALQLTDTAIDTPLGAVEPGRHGFVTGHFSIEDTSGQEAQGFCSVGSYLIVSNVAGDLQVRHDDGSPADAEGVGE